MVYLLDIKDKGLWKEIKKHKIDNDHKTLNDSITDLLRKAIGRG